MLRLFSNRNGNGQGSSSSDASMSKGMQGMSGNRMRAGGKPIGGIAASRKMDEAQSRPSSSPLKNTESTFKMIARRLSFGSNRRKSLTKNNGNLSIKDGTLNNNTNVLVPANIQCNVNVNDHHHQQHNNNNEQQQQQNNVVIPKEVPIERRMLTQAVIDEEKNKLINDLGIDTANIVIRISNQFTPVDDGSDVINISTMSPSTMKFCGRNAPPISLAIYLSRLIRNINNALSEDGNHVDSVGVRCLLIAVIYIKRMQLRQPDFQINMLNVHRLFFVAMTDALKVNEDEHPDNKYMAIVGGVDTSQLNTLEAAFCTGNDFNFIVTVDELQQMYHAYHSKAHVVIVPENHRTYPVRRVSWESRA